MHAAATIRRNKRIRKAVERFPTVDGLEPGLEWGC